jgi:hypothetical protein
MRLFVLTSIFFPSLALAQTMDGGTSTVADGGMMMPDAGGCGPITFEGECQGDILSYCDTDNDEVIMVDCDAEYGPATICTEIDPTYGFDCALATGESCLFDIGSGEFAAAFCQGNAPGCVETAEDATCEENVGTCVDGDVRSCRGDRLVVECNVGQPWVVDCAGYAGTCETDHCLVPGGILCDDDVLVCQPGTSCNNLGICVNDNLVDAGTPDTGAPDSGVSVDSGSNVEEEDDGKCTCMTAQNDRRSPYLLLLVAAWFIVKRRVR